MKGCCAAIVQLHALTLAWAFVLPLGLAKRLGWRNRGVDDGSLRPALRLNRPRRRGSRHGLPGHGCSRSAAALTSLRGFRRRLGWFSGLCFKSLRFGLGLFASRLRGLLGLLQCFASLLELGLRQARPFTSRLNSFFCCLGHSAQVNIRFGAWLLDRLHSSVPQRSPPASATDTALKAGTRSQST